MQDFYAGYLGNNIGLVLAVYCCFMTNTLFTTMFTVIIMVRSLKSMCIPSFVLIGSCVNQLHAHQSPYRNVCPEALLLTLGARAQRGLRYLVSVSVCLLPVFLPSRTTMRTTRHTIGFSGT